MGDIMCTNNTTGARPRAPHTQHGPREQVGVFATDGKKFGGHQHASAGDRKRQRGKS